MHEYDVALKNLLTTSGNGLLPAISDRSELRWLNVELPKVNNLRVDLLGEAPGRELVHFEFQSRNERGFTLRMAEYSFAIKRRYRRFPRQIAIYVGAKPLRMTNSVSTPDLRFRFKLIDIRDIDGEALLTSRNLSDNVMAMLTRLGEQPGTVKQILQKIVEAPVTQRREALANLSILAGLRGLSSKIKQEARRMPITESIMDNEIFGPAIRKGIAQGRVEGQTELLLNQIVKRFGSVPPRIRKRLKELTPRQLKAVSLRLLDAQTVAELFPR